MQDADELHDALLVLGVLPESTALAFAAIEGTGAISEWFESLECRGQGLPNGRRWRHLLGRRPNDFPS